MAWTLTERADSRYPGGAGLSFENGRSVVNYMLRVETIEDVQDALKHILGAVDFNGEGGLTRVLPKANPFLPHHFAARVSSIVGAGRNSVADVTYDFAAEPIALQCALYTSPNGIYDIRVEFEPKPYQVLPDEDIVTPPLTYYDYDGSTVTAITNAEYERFTVPDGNPAPTLAYAQTGQLQFYTGTGTVSDTTAHEKTFSGFPFTVLPDGKFSLTWHQVPFDLISDSMHPMWTYVGKVNQQEFFGRKPGSLLYMGPKVVRRYLPPVPEIDITGSGVTFRMTYLADILFDFNFTAREVTDPPTFSNKNWIADGWNCQPFRLDGKFYYVGLSVESANARIPNHLSAPMQMLFSCPIE